MGPRFTADINFDSRKRILVRFADESLKLIPERDATGFVVRDEGRAVEIKSTRRFLGHSFVLTLREPLEGSATVSLGSGKHGGNVTDSSEYRLPAETFLERPVGALP